ncbi:MAG TPA: aminoglycoside phosphotransferase family protein [Pyrinomonadaceae bacterium]
MDETPERPATIRHYRRLANEIIEKHFGTPPRRIVYRRSGRTNYVFAVNHVEGQFIVRISPELDRIDAFKKELWASQKVREAGVPSTEVLIVEQDEDSEPYMITRRVTGSEATHHPQRERIIHQMGHYARLINSIPTKGFGGHFDWAHEGFRCRTWVDYLDDEWELERRLLVFTAHKILSQGAVTKLRRIVDDTRTLGFQPFLNHGDLRLKNTMVDDDGEIAAIIDWEDCLSTLAPQFELAISLHDLSIDEKHVFIDGYGIDSEAVVPMAPLIRALNIINYSDAIERAAEVRDHKSMAQFKLRLNAGLDLYSLC